MNDLLITEHFLTNCQSKAWTTRSVGGAFTPVSPTVQKIDRTRKRKRKRKRNRILRRIFIPKSRHGHEVGVFCRRYSASDDHYVNQALIPEKRPALMPESGLTTLICRHELRTACATYAHARSLCFLGVAFCKQSSRAFGWAMKGKMAREGYVDGNTRWRSRDLVHVKLVCWLKDGFINRTAYR